jgi:hypothetical protein
MANIKLTDSVVNQFAQSALQDEFPYRYSKPCEWSWKYVFLGNQPVIHPHMLIVWEHKSDLKRMKSIPKKLGGNTIMWKIIINKDNKPTSIKRVNG